MTEIIAPYTDDDLLSDNVSKKDLVTFLQENASGQFLVDHKLAGAVKNVIKTKTKDQLADDYKQLFSAKSFKTSDNQLPTPEQVSAKAAEAEALENATQKAKKLNLKEPEAVKYTKRILKMGDKVTFPQKGDTVACYYTGKLDNGKVFDTNIEEGKKAKAKAQPLRFKVGLGKVIKGWDEALLTMTEGERAEIIIQPEWAYGKKGIEGKIPPNSTLTFEVELVSVGD